MATSLRRRFYKKLSRFPRAKDQLDLMELPTLPRPEYDMRNAVAIFRNGRLIFPTKKQIAYAKSFRKFLQHEGINNELKMST